MSLLDLVRRAFHALLNVSSPPHGSGQAGPEIRRASEPQMDDLSRFSPTAFSAEHDPDAVTLAYAQQWLAARMDDGATCPCCTQFAKVYARTITSTMAYALVLMHRHEGPEWFHVPSYLSRVARLAASTARGGDWAKLVHWGLIEEAPERREDNCPHTGYYRGTDMGRRFVSGQLSVPRWAVLFDGRLLYLDDGRRTTIEQALGKRFNYAELMSTSPADLP